MNRWDFSSGLIMAGFILTLAQEASAESLDRSVTFQHKEWDLICDNTLTCRAVGYSASDAEPGATVLITREAGPSTPVTNRVMLADYDGEIASSNPGTPILLIDNQSQGKLAFVDDSWRMSGAQFTAFKQALRRDSKISFKDNLHEYLLSAAGSSAVLLKMDDLQGRIGTVGALIKKGNKSESSVKMPVPLPEVIKTPVQDKEAREMSADEQEKIQPLLIGKAGDCMDDQLAKKWSIARLNKKYSLVLVPCYMGAYNSAEMYFVVDHSGESAPTLLTDMANYYEDGRIGYSMKGRGLGDCWSLKEWVWNGQAFVVSSAQTTGRCAMIQAGGAWDLPTIKTKVVTR